MAETLKAGNAWYQKGNDRFQKPEVNKMAETLKAGNAWYQKGSDTVQKPVDYFEQKRLLDKGYNLVDQSLVKNSPTSEDYLNVNSGDLAYKNKLMGQYLLGQSVSNRMNVIDQLKSLGTPQYSDYYNPLQENWATTMQNAQTSAGADLATRGLKNSTLAGAENSGLSNMAYTLNSGLANQARNSWADALRSDLGFKAQMGDLTSLANEYKDWWGKKNDMKSRDKANDNAWIGGLAQVAGAAIPLL